MSEPASSTAGGVALWKIVTSMFGVGIVAAAMGFLVMWPRTMKEAAIRVFFTLTGSAFLGPALVAAAYHQWPGIFGAGVQLAEKVGLEPWFGLFMVAAPLLAMAGLPFWWIVGAVVLWFDKRKGRDLGELAKDAVADAKAAMP